MEAFLNLQPKAPRYPLTTFCTILVLIIVLLAAGPLFSLRPALSSCACTGESIRVVSEKPPKEGAISSFQALMAPPLPGWAPATSWACPPPSARLPGGLGAAFWMDHRSSSAAHPLY